MTYEALIRLIQRLGWVSLVLTLGCSDKPSEGPLSAPEPTLGFLGHDCVGHNYEIHIGADDSIYLLKLRSVWQMTSDSTFDAHTIAFSSMPNVAIGDTLYWSEGIRITLLHDDGITGDYITQGNGARSFGSEGFFDIPKGFPESLRIEQDLFDPTVIYTQRPGQNKLLRRDCP